MLFKWLILSVVVYFIYRNFIAVPKIDRDRSRDQERKIQNEKDGTAEDGEYIDYEELD